MIDALACSVVTVDACWSNGPEWVQYIGVLLNCFIDAQPNGAP